MYHERRLGKNRKMVQREQFRQAVAASPEKKYQSTIRRKTEDVNGKKDNETDEDEAEAQRLRRVYESEDVYTVSHSLDRVRILSNLARSLERDFITASPGLGPGPSHLIPVHFLLSAHN